MFRERADNMLKYQTMMVKRLLTDNCAIHLLCLDRGSGYIAAIFPVDPSPSSLSLRSEDDMI